MACQSKSSGLESVDVDVDDAGGSTTAVGTMDAPRTARREPRAAVVGAARRIDLFPESADDAARVDPAGDADAGRGGGRTAAGDAHGGRGDARDGGRREHRCVRVVPAREKVPRQLDNGDVSSRGPWRVSTRAEKDTVKKETVEQLC